jgi:FkbM family methyltransferase
LYARLFQDVSYSIQEGVWSVDFAGKTVRLPLRNSNLWLDWDLALAIGGHDAEVKMTYENFIRSGSVKTFFDIGTNYGTHSLLFLSHHIDTISFEPIAALKKDFDNLCSLNQLKGNLQNMAVGEKSGTATLLIPLNETWDATISENGAEILKDRKEVEKVEVPVITIDEFVSKNNKIPELIKIDTEGNEIHVLRGGINTIKEHKPAIIFETNKFSERQTLWDFFKANNYIIQDLPYSPGQPVKTFTIDQFLKKGSTNYIAVPAV